jgi:hypothetical protein
VTAGNGDGEAQALDEDIVESVGISIDNNVTELFLIVFLGPLGLSRREKGR